jgi:quercetin dioxygenase-like cupin family protein
MKTAELPHLTVYQTGNTFKVLQVTGLAGMSMPEHFCTGEAVLVVQRGSAVLRMKGDEFPLKQHDAMVIPHEEKHSLVIGEDFQAQVIMATDAEIKFA